MREMRVFEPNDGNFADHETGVVMFNQFGATASQDTGRDAQVLADFAQLPVLAVDRPGTAGFMPSKALAGKLSTPDGYLVQMKPLGKVVDSQADDLGIRRLIATGRSAGALASLALANTETVGSLCAIFAAEPVGCEQLSLEEGKKRYSSYLKRQKELLNTVPDEELVKPMPPGLPLFPALGRLLSMPSAMFFDRFHNQKLFASDAARYYAAYIAEELNQVDTTLVFAEHSMVATPKVYQRDILPLTGLRKRGVRFEVSQTKDTVHASFDNREYINKLIKPTIDRTLGLTY